MSMNAVSANLNMATALRIRNEAIEMNVSLSSYISDLIEEALEARDYQSLGMDVGDADIPTHATDPDFDPRMITDTYTEPTGFWAWLKKLFGMGGMGKVIAEGQFGEDPEHYKFKQEIASMKDEDFKLEWNELERANTAPPTEDEIAYVMGSIRKMIARGSNSGIVSVTTRREVADHISDSINEANEDIQAITNIGDDPWFDKDKRCYVSTLTVGRDKVTLGDYIDSY